MQKQIIAMFEKAFPGDVIVDHVGKITVAVCYTGNDVTSWRDFLKSINKDFILSSEDDLEIVITSKQDMDAQRDKYIAIMDETGFDSLTEAMQAGNVQYIGYRMTVPEIAVIALFSVSLDNDNLPVNYTADQAKVVLEHGLETKPSEEDINKFLEIQEPFNKYLVKRQELATVKDELAQLVAKRDTCQPDTIEHSGVLMGISSRIGRQDSIERTLKPLITTVRFLAGNLN